MIIEEEGVRTDEVNPDIIDEALFAGEEEDEIEVTILRDDEDADSLDLAFVDEEYEM